MKEIAGGSSTGIAANAETGTSVNTGTLKLCNWRRRLLWRPIETVSQRAFTASAGWREHALDAQGDGAAAHGRSSGCPEYGSHCREQGRCRRGRADR